MGVDLAFITLREALEIRSREHLAVVGAGGKTSLMFALASELAGRGKRVLASTTTKIWHWQALSAATVVLMSRAADWRSEVEDGLERGPVFLGDRLLESGKIQGISSSLADRLYREEDLDYLLVEADGAAGLPVKAPADHEPVIPSSATKVVALLGLDAMDKSSGPDLVFRGELFFELTRTGPGEKLTPAVLSKLFRVPNGAFKGCPDKSERVAFLNKSDILPQVQRGAELADLILKGPRRGADRVVIGSVKQGRYMVRVM